MENKSRNNIHKSTKRKHQNRHDLLCWPLLTIEPTKLKDNIQILSLTHSVIPIFASSVGHVFNLFRFILFIHQSETIANL